MKYSYAKRQIQVMVVDDILSMRDLLEEQLTEAGYQTLAYASAKDALRALSQTCPDIIIVDVKMPEMNGLDFCRQISTTYPQIRTIVMTAFGNMDRAIEAMRVGAFDFLPKPFHFDILEMTIQRALEHVSLHSEVSQLKKQHELAEAIIGESEAVQLLKTQIQRMAMVDLPIFISGESGVGKELVAQSLHQHSTRSSKPFITVNCATLPTELLESELFGHEKGAFTGAIKAHKGLFRQADGGTLFLDEIGDMPFALQSKLLRVLQEQQVRPIGGTREIPVDVRVISATHQNIIAEASKSFFRRDLLFRLNVLNIKVPPLRERASDILLLARYFLKKAAMKYEHVSAQSFSAEAASFMLSYHWPGNVRELQNNVLAASAMCMGTCVSVDFFPAFQTHDHKEDVIKSGSLDALDDVINHHILRVLHQMDGNKSLAARRLGIDRKTLYARLSRIEEQ